MHTVRNARPPGTPLGEVTAVLGDFDLGVVHDSGANIHLASYSGWDAPAPTVGEAIQNAGGDGARLTPAYDGPRPVTLLVHIDGGSYLHAGEVLAQLKAAIPTKVLGDLTVNDGNQVLTARVRKSGDAPVQRNGSRASIAIGLIAPDPNRYDPDPITASTGLPSTVGGLSLPLAFPMTIGATVVSGRLTMTNKGDAPTRPVFIITGPCPPATITHVATGRRLVIPEAVPAGRSLTIDADIRRALLDGTATRTVTGTWFDLLPGVNDIAFDAATYDAGAQLTASARSAWR